MLKVISRCTSSKNFLVFTSKCKKHVFNSVFQDQIHCVSVVHLCYSQKRFNSSKVSENPLHKVFFVNAESPPSLEKQDFDNVVLPTSSTETNVTSDSIEYIPPPPVPPSSDYTGQVEILNVLGEPTFESLGLGGLSPIGIVQNSLEFLHVAGDLPWWGAIAVVTVVLRSLLFPLVVKSQRHSAVMSNFMPAVQSMQTRISEARASGNDLEASKASYELQKFMKDNGLNPVKSMVLPLAQLPIFLSMLIGLRRCVNLPVESMKEGGLYWFTDLTIADPYYGLPIFTCITMMATIKVGTDGQPVSDMAGAKLLKYVLPAIPILIFPFTCHFPAAILCYWVCTNFFSLLQVGILRVPKVRNYFNISERIKHETTVTKKKGFVTEMKESFSNMKAVSNIAERHRLDAQRFEQAGRVPLVKTFKHNPLTDIKAKPRDS